MKKLAIVVTVMMIMVLYSIVEVTTDLAFDPIRSEVYSVACAEGYNYAGVHHLSKKDDVSKLDELLDEVTRNAEHEEGDDHIWVHMLDNNFKNDNMYLMRVTKGQRNLGKPEKAGAMCREKT